jgi:predicted acyltransferase
MGLVVAGGFATSAGLIWGFVFPLNKNIWTSSYVLFTAGLACLALAGCSWLLDRREQAPRWATPFVVFGMNPIAAYVGAELFARLMYSVIQVRTARGVVPIEVAIYRDIYAPMASPKAASLAFALTVVLFWYVVLDVMYRRRVFFKV